MPFPVLVLNQSSDLYSYLVLSCFESSPFLTSRFFCLFNLSPLADLILDPAPLVLIPGPLDNDSGHPAGYPASCLLQTSLPVHPHSSILFPCAFFSSSQETCVVP